MNDRKGRQNVVADAADICPDEPLWCYSWTVVDTAGDAGAVGVSDNLARALVHAGKALGDAPEGARALVHQVTRSEFRLGYRYHRLVAHGRYDRTAGGIAVWAAVWELNPARDAFRAPFTEGLKVFTLLDVEGRS